MWWYQRISRILLRHHWSSASITRNMLLKNDAFYQWQENECNLPNGTFFPKGPSSWVGDPWHMMYTVLIQSASSCFKTTSRTLPNFRRTFATSRFQVSNYLLQTTDFCLMTFLVGWHKTTTKQRFWRSCIACALKLEYYTLQTNYSV